ncbi:MAG: T9SS type A sorting domain-containing protein [Bacteroidetes bacterium]|nr:T9SS type A sorting domain-containing protein [Bacteroidota bacterium]
MRNPQITSDQSNQPGTVEENSKCGLELVNSIVFNINNFTEEQQRLLKPLLQRPVTDTSFDTPGGFFKVHYDLSGTHAPAYNLDLLAEALDSTYKFQIDFLGYNTPPGDSAANPNIPSEDYGGDNRYDVYISNLGSGFYGFTQFETEIEPGSSKFTSYMVIDNDFLNYFSIGINGAQVTVAHEFHHSIQGGNYIFRSEDTFFYELTSTAMEEFVFDDVNDYYQYNSSYFRSPETPLPLTLGYNVATWDIFLRDNFDYDIIKRQWELMPLVRAMIAINNSLFESGSSFAREYNKYGIWMYFTNYRADLGSYFEEAVNYPLVKKTSVIQFTPPSQTLDMSSKAAAHTFVTFVIPGSNDSLVTIVSNGDVQSAVGTPNKSFNFKYTLFSDSTSGVRFLTENYSSTFSADNPALWSVSEILNKVVVREDDASFSPPNASTFVFPNPFNYGFNNEIVISLNAKIGETVELDIYSISMELVYKSEKTIILITKNSSNFIGITWNALDDSGKKLASGVYIYVIKKGDDVTKGKVVLFN